jgi:glycosyltransferase involved in cell wall biosynthesis
MNILVLLPNLQSNSFTPQEIIDRQNVYALAVKKLKGRQKVKMIAVYSHCSEALNTREVELKCVSRNQISVIWFAIHTLRYVRRVGFVPESIIAGTPFQPLLAALMLKLFIPSARIHTAVHGDLASLIDNDFKSMLKLLFLRFSIRHCSSIRFVSMPQLEKAKQLLNMTNRHVFVTPVPIPYLSKVQKYGGGSKIAFVGRLQQERGIPEWIEIGKRFESDQLVVIGDGPLAAKIRTELPRANFLGNLSHKEVQNRWSSIGVLLSSAPYESYGLSMREAILNGVPVVSRKNAGSTELQANYPELIALYETLDEAEFHIKRFLDKRPSEELFRKFEKDFFISQDESLKKLAVAWTNEF